MKIWTCREVRSGFEEFAKEVYNCGVAGVNELLTLPAERDHFAFSSVRLQNVQTTYLEFR